MLVLGKAIFYILILQEKIYNKMESCVAYSSFFPIGLLNKIFNRTIYYITIYII